MWRLRILTLSFLSGVCLLACAQTESPSTTANRSSGSAPVGGDTQALDRARKSLAAAEQFLAAGQYTQAVEAASEAGKYAQESPEILHRAAEVLYRSGASQESLRLFDRAVELDPSTAPFNWQRGIALCSRGEFARGAEQFASHHQVNPDDVENSAWHFLCVAKVQSVEEARKSVIPSRGDGRQPMMSVLSMLQGKLEPESVMQAAVQNTADGPARRRAQFYADLYVGLYYDSLNQTEQAKKYLQRSLSYGDSGYMVDVARVYLADRFGQKQSPD